MSPTDDTQEGTVQEKKGTVQEISDNWCDIENVFESVAKLELNLQEFQKERRADWPIKKELAFQRLSEKYQISEDKIRFSYHAFILNKKHHEKQKDISRRTNSRRRNHQHLWISRTALWLRSKGSSVVSWSARHAVLVGAITAFVPTYNLVRELAEGNKLRQEEIFQARRTAIEQELKTLKESDADDGSLEIKNAIELLAAEGKSLDGLELDNRNLSLLDVSPNNLRDIKQSFVAGDRWIWPINWIVNISSALTENILPSTDEQNNSEIDGEKPCTLRLSQQGSLSHLSDEILCVSMERASFKNAQLQSANFNHATLLDADFSSTQVESGTQSKEAGSDQPEEIESQRTDLTNVSFVNTDLTRAKFDHGKLELADFRRARLSAASFSGAYLNWADFTGVQGIEPSSFIEALQKAGDSWRYAAYDSELRRDDQMCEKIALLPRNSANKILGHKPNVDFNRDIFEEYIKKLEKDEQDRIVLDCFNFYPFKDSNFFKGQDTLFIKANFENSNLSYVNLSGTNLSQANLKGTNLQFTNFIGITLEKLSPEFLAEIKDDFRYVRNARFVAYDREVHDELCEYWQPFFLVHESADRGSDVIGRTPARDSESAQEGVFSRAQFESYINGLRDRNNLNFNCYNFSAFNGKDFFENQILEGADFSRSNLFGVSFRSSNLNNAKFSEADLEKANFEGSNLRNTDFSGANIKYANFTNIGVEAINISSLVETDNSERADNSEYAIFSKELRAQEKLCRHVQLVVQAETEGKITILGYTPNTHFTEDQFSAFIENLRFKEALDFSCYNLLPFYSVDFFDEKDLSNADFSHSDVRRLRFTNSDLSNAKFEGADLTYTNFTGITPDRIDLNQIILADNYERSVYSSELRNTQSLCGKAVFLLQESAQPNSQVSGYDKHEVLVFSQDELRNYIDSLRRAERLELSCLSFEDFQNSELLEGLNLAGFDLRKSRFQNVSLSSANLSGANLSGANLSNANLSGADLSGADLSGANLSNAIITREQLEQAASYANALLDENIL